MKGFIEVTDEQGTKHLINIRHIEDVMNSTIAVGEGKEDDGK